MSFGRVNCINLRRQQPAAAARQYFPEGGQPYPIPMPPEGSQNDPIDTGNPRYTVRSVTDIYLGSTTVQYYNQNFTIPDLLFENQHF